jgi:DNA polymerase-3 subunit delta'
MPIGHQKQWQFLKKSAELGKISHAYLFSGPEKVGKKKIALEWIQLLLGEKIQLGKNPDLILIEPEEKEIKISQIRELIWKLSLKPYSASLKVAIIDKAHLMNQEAQNCFLKTLEEPKKNTYLILITEYPESLLPTILSRCQIIKFYSVSKKEIEDYLTKEKINKEKIQEVLKFSMGKPGRAIDFISNSEKLEEWQKNIKTADKILNLDLSSKFQYAKDLAQKNNLREVLEIWLSYFRDILFGKINQGDFDSLIKLKKIIEKIQETNFLLSATNINQRLALEILMLEFN